MGAKSGHCLRFNSYRLGGKTDVMKELKTIKEVKKAHRIYGVYDIIAQIEADTMMDLRDIISEKVRRLYGVRSTITIITLWNPINHSPIHDIRYHIKGCVQYWN